MHMEEGNQSGELAISDGRGNAQEQQYAMRRKEDREGLKIAGGTVVFWQLGFVVTHSSRPTYLL